MSALKSISNFYQQMIVQLGMEFHQAMLDQNLARALQVLRMMVSISYLDDKPELMEKYNELESKLQNIITNYKDVDADEKDKAKTIFEGIKKELYNFSDYLFDRFHERNVFLTEVHVVSGSG